MKMDVFIRPSELTEDVEESQSSERLTSEIWSGGRLLSQALDAFEVIGMSSTTQELITLISKSLLEFSSSPNSVSAITVAYKVASVHQALQSVGRQNALLASLFEAARARGADGGWACHLAMNLFALIGPTVFTDNRSWLLTDVIVALATSHDESLVRSLMESVLVSFVSACLDEEGRDSCHSLLEALDHLTSSSSIEA